MVPFYAINSGGNGSEDMNFAGFGTAIPWYAYAASQPGVILHYLRLCFWPVGLRLDYEWPLARTAGAIVVPGLIIAALAGVTLWATMRRPKLGFLGAWFFVILAPSSSIVPITSLAVEHRMYLPLAAVALATVLATYALAARAGGLPAVRRKQLAALAAVLTVVLGGLTLARNRVYRDDITMWSDVLAQDPNSGRAHQNLAVMLSRINQHDLAFEHFRRNVELNPSDARGHVNLGLQLVEKRAFDAALAEFQLAVKLNPRLAVARTSLGTLLAVLGKPGDAIEQFGIALELDPRDMRTRDNLAVLLTGQGQLDEAAQHFRTVLESNPLDPRALEGLQRIELTRRESLARP